MMQFSTRELNQQTNMVQEYAREAPVLITDRGKPDQVLLSYSDYEKLVNTKAQSSKFISVADALSGSEKAADFDFDPPRVEISFRPIEF